MRLPPITRAGLVAVVLLAGAVAQAAAPAEERALSLIEEGEFEQALEVIEQGLSQPGVASATVARLCELQGTAHLYLGKEEAARKSFARLLQAAPEYELAKGTSSKIRALFDKVKADVGYKPLKIDHAPVASAKAGERLEVKAEIGGLPEGARARLHYRRQGNDAYSSVFFARAQGDKFLAYVPSFELPAEEGNYALEYYLEIADSAGRRMAGVGTDLEPLSVRVNGEVAEGPGPGPAVETESWYQKWWVWAIAGTVAAGATAAVAVPLILDDQATVQVTVKVQQ